MATRKMSANINYHIIVCPPDPNSACLNMAASNQGIAGALNIIKDMIARLDSLNDPHCVEGFAIRLEALPLIQTL